MVDIYAKIKEAIQHIDPSEGAVDITGGKKVMSSGAAIAGAYLGLDVLYLDSFEYDPKTKLPVPGKEQLLRIDNLFTGTQHLGTK